jgi:phosphatidylethanolamine/phosphatidyl-N-methylethanolamine N-methyltransferase
MTKPVKRRTHRERRKKFIAAWLRSPLKMGSVIPSSRALARTLADAVDQELPGVVVELGGGTGVVTHALRMAGIDPKRMIVIEREKELHAMLAEQYQDMRVLHEDAMYLTRVLAQHKVSQVAAIVSSLPMLSLPEMVREAIEDEVISAIKSGGMIVQFTYGARSPLPRKKLAAHGIAGKRIKTILANVPPAHVWVYRQAQT